MSMNDCEDIQARLAESDLQQVDQQTLAHVKTCPACSAYLDALTKLHADIKQLPMIDVPRELVETTIKNITKEPIQTRRMMLHTQLASGFAALFMCIAVFILFQDSNFSKSVYSTGNLYFSEPISSESKSAPSPKARPLDSISQETVPDISVVVEEKTRAHKDTDDPNKGNFSTGAEEEAERATTLGADVAGGAGTQSSLQAKNEFTERDSSLLTTKDERRKFEKKKSKNKSDKLIESKPQQILAFRTSDTDVLGGRQDTNHLTAPSLKNVGQSTTMTPPTSAPAPVVSAGKVSGLAVGSEGLFDDEQNVQSRRNQEISGEVIAKQEASTARPTPRIPRKTAALKEPLVSSHTEYKKLQRQTNEEASAYPSEQESIPEGEEEEIFIDHRQIATEFLKSINTTSNLVYQSATGYWANNYLPGDPDIRLLEARLALWDRALVAQTVGRGAALEKSIQPNRQPFDPPSNAALAVYLHADHNAVQDPTRMRLQLGIQATERFSGHRPAMNIGIVVDANNLSEESVNAKVKALLRAVSQSAQSGDRFSLTVAGPQGGIWIKPDDFRHGQIQVAINKLFSAQQDTDTNANTPSLLEAMQLSSQNVQQHDDPTAVLGSSMILLITASPLANQIQKLEALAHQNAVNGVTTTVFPLGNAIDISNVDRLVLSGQGHRRILQKAEDAEKLIAKELLSSSKAVARAVRLRIRLSKNVKLVEVLDSYRLDEPSAQRVREAEQSIDRRLSRNFGIVADRGEDEEGIQIVIPSFFAGDSHVILLDVVAEQSGSIADVTVRYKDLLYLRNGVARANLSLPTGKNDPGILENNVLKSYLALKLSQSTRQASTQLAASDFKSAQATLQNILNLYQGMRLLIPSWNEDDDLKRDEALLNQYLVLLRSHQLQDQMQFISDSLRYSSYRKLLTTDDSLQ